MKATTKRNFVLFGFLVLAMLSLAGSGKVGGLVPICRDTPMLNGRTQPCPRPSGTPLLSPFALPEPQNSR